MSNSKHIVVLARALQVLEWLAQHGKPAGVTELGNGLQIPKASVYRILRTLEDHQIVIQDSETELYTLGPGILRLSHDIKLEPVLVPLVQPFLEDLSRRTGETASLGVIRDGKVLVLRSVSKSDSRLTIDLGPVADLHCSSLGKALLLDKDLSEIKSLIGSRSLHAYTRNTLRTVDELSHQLDSVRKAGVSMDNEETEEGLICYGAPIRHWAGRVVAAISVSAPKARAEGPKAQQIRQLVLEASLDVGKRLTGPAS